MQEPAEHGPASFGLPYLHPRRMRTFTTCQSQAFMASDVIRFDLPTGTPSRARCHTVEGGEGDPSDPFPLSHCKC
jgi:hypothetical protein